MIYIFAIYILLIIISSRIDNNNDYLSLEKTTVIKGIFIILVFLSHFNSYVIYSNALDNVYIKIIGYVGQAMVAPFLFYSGYGVMEQINKKGNSYIKSFPVKRILVTMIKFDLAVLLFYIINILLNNAVSFKKIILSLVGWDSLGNSNWYIFTIIVLYIITYFSYSIIKNKNISLSMTTILTLIYIFLLYYFNIKESYWYDTSLCYVLGMYYSNFKKKIYKYINYNTLTYITSVIIFILITFALKKYSYYYMYTNILLNLSFSILIILITMKISINNKIFLWCGKNLFEIYILQRIPMIILKQFGIVSNIYVYFVFCIIITIILVLVFKIVTAFIISKIKFAS